MKIFKNCAAQGDLLIRRIDKLPVGVVPVEPENGVFVVAHSETGHHHVITAERVKAYRPSSGDIYKMFLEIPRLSEEEMPVIQHLRSFDTHEALRPNEGGVFEIRRQREYTPEGWRRAQD